MGWQVQGGGGGTWYWWGVYIICNVHKYVGKKNFWGRKCTIDQCVCVYDGTSDVVIDGSIERVCTHRSC